MKMGIEFFRPFVEGTKNTLKAQCQIGALTEKPFFKSSGPKVLFEIAAVIGLTGKNFTGSIALCFPKEVFLKVMTNMLGEPYTDITDDMQDGAAELLNMIFGQAKIVLNEAGYEIEKAIPTVIKGHQIETQHPADRPVLVFPFRTEAGVFHIEIVTEQKADSK